MSPCYTSISIAGEWKSNEEGYGPEEILHCRRKYVNLRYGRQGCKSWNSCKSRFYFKKCFMMIRLLSLFAKLTKKQIHFLSSLFKTAVTGCFSRTLCLQEAFSASVPPDADCSGVRQTGPLRTEQFQVGGGGGLWNRRYQVSVSENVFQRWDPPEGGTLWPGLCAPGSLRLCISSL